LTRFSFSFYFYFSKKTPQEAAPGVPEKKETKEEKNEEIEKPEEVKVFSFLFFS
jgi:hypothetical protein